MLILKKTILHLFVVLIICVSLSSLFYSGNLLLPRIIAVDPHVRWKYNYPFRYLMDIAVAYSLLGYLVYLTSLFFLKKNNIHLSESLLAVISFLLVACLFSYGGASSINISDPFVIKNFIAIGFAGFIGSLVKKEVFKKYYLSDTTK